MSRFNWGLFGAVVWCVAFWLVMVWVFLWAV